MKVPFKDWHSLGDKKELIAYQPLRDVVLSNLMPMISGSTN